MSSLRTEMRADARTLASGMMVAQAAALLATPLLTRLYSPDSFGTYAYFLAAVATCAPVAALRFDAALPLTGSDVEAGAMVRIGLSASIATALFAAMTMVLGTQLFSGQLAIGTPLGQAVRWLPVGILLAGAFQVGAAWEVRRAAVGRAAAGRAAQGLGTAAAQMLITPVGVLRHGLIVGDVLGRVVATLVVLPAALRAALSREARKATGAVYLRYRGFGTFATGAALLNAVNAALPVLAVGYFLGVDETGRLLLAQRVAGLPTALLATAVSQAFAVHLARRPAGIARRSLFDATLRSVAMTSAVPFALIAAIAPIGFESIFGPQWRDAGSAAAILVPFYAAQLHSAATMTAVDVLQLHRQRLVRELLYLVGGISVLGLAGQFNLGFTVMLAALSGFGVCFYFGSLWWVRRRLASELA